MARHRRAWQERGAWQRYVASRGFTSTGRAPARRLRRSRSLLRPGCRPCSCLVATHRRSVETNPSEACRHLLLVNPANNRSLAWIKFAGATYFVGVFAFAYAFYCIHSAVLAFDDMLHATREKDATAVQLCSRTTGTMMMRATHRAIVGALAFLIGTCVGLFVLIRF